MLGRLLVRSSAAWLRASSALHRAVARGERGLAAVLARALDGDEKAALGVALYDGSPLHRGTELLPWEPAWLARRLPPAPARILVGACGAGRELLALAAAGYVVDGFDPAADLLRVARARLGDRARLERLSYQELSAAVLDGARDLGCARERYDAVLLGWGSIHHLGDAGERLRLVHALERLCPRGPLLASFWSGRDDDVAEPVSAIERAGALIGRGVAALRGLPSRSPPHETFVSFAGFVYPFTRDEVEALARAVGRTVAWDNAPDEYPHVAFLHA